MSERTPSGTQPQAPAQAPLTHVTLTFNRQVTEAEVRQMQSQHNAVSAVRTVGGHHHDHDTTLE
jgi:hypothetical protein